MIKKSSSPTKMAKKSNLNYNIPRKDIKVFREIPSAKVILHSQTKDMS